MKTLIAIALLLGAATLPGKSASAAPAIHPWCLENDGGAFSDCAFYTFEQCRQAAQADGICERNPRFDSQYRGRPPADVDPPRRPGRYYDR